MRTGGPARSYSLGHSCRTTECISAIKDMPEIWRDAASADEAAFFTANIEYTIGWKGDARAKEYLSTYDDGVGWCGAKSDLRSLTLLYHSAHDCLLIGYPVHDWGRASHGLRKASGYNPVKSLRCKRFFLIFCLCYYICLSTRVSLRRGVTHG